MSIQIDTVEPAIAGYMRIANSRVYSETQGGSLSSSGTLILNLESTWGLGSTGMFLIRGNENGGNQSQRMYLWTMSNYGNERQVSLKAIGATNRGNAYGDVYAYLSDYSNSWTTLTQGMGGTSSAVSNIYFRNAQGAGCTYSLMNWRTG
jgi:hypothetical protein